MPGEAIDTVRAWHAALNDADVERLLTLSTADVEVGGPRGAGHGADLLRDWLARAAIHLEPGRIYGRAEVVVVEQTARWRAADGRLAEPQPAATIFRVRNGRVSSVMRYANIATALADAGFESSDEHAPGRPLDRLGDV